MLRAGALMYVLFISMIMYLISAFFFTYLFVQNSLFIDRYNVDAQNALINSAVQVMLDKQDIFNYGVETELDLFEDQDNITIFIKKRWGLYNINQVKLKGNSRSKYFMVGKKISLGNRTGLHLAMSEKKLILGGTTYLSGKCFVPGGNIEQSRSGDMKFQGIIENVSEYSSESQLPKLNEQFEKYLNEWVFSMTTPNDSILYYEKVKTEGNRLINTFDNKTIRLIADNDIRIDGYYSGNIVIVSQNKVIIESTAILKETILVASDVVVNKGFKGSVQVFAKDSIFVDDSCRFNYPSTLMVYGEGRTKIELNERTLLKGNVIAVTGGIKTKSSRLKINKGVKVYGLLYSNVTSEFEGECYGSYYASNFYYTSQTGNKYSNFLYNVKIDPKNLPKEFVSSYIVDVGTSKAEIIKWLE